MFATTITIQKKTQPYADCSLGDDFIPLANSKHGKVDQKVHQPKSNFLIW
jgi:hypothetical protein